MNRKLKTIGLGVVAALALSAAAASPASAFQVEAESYTAKLTGQQINEHRLVIANGVRTVTCKKALFEGHLTAATTVATITPTYTECHHIPGLGPATITNNECDYTAHPTTLTGTTTGTGDVTVICPTGKSMTVHTYETVARHTALEPLCTYTVDPQGPIAGTAEFHNEGVGKTRDIQLTLALKEIALTVTQAKSKLLCGGVAGDTIKAKYEGPSGNPAKITVTADTEPGAQQGLFVD